MNIKAFFVDALASALELGIGTPEDVLRHVTPDVLAHHLPRPLWARLLTACLGAPRVTPRLVVETVGIPNLCEHVPATIIWACIGDIGLRAIGKTPEVAAAKKSSMLAPPPEVIGGKPSPAPTPPRGTGVGPSIPTPAKGVAVGASASASESAPAPEQDAPSSTRSRTPTGQRFRQSGTGVRTLGGVARRPQAVATPTPLPSIARGSSPKRPDPAEYETETAVEAADWRDKEIIVDDEQLVDWQADPSSAITGDDDFSDLGGRKR